MHLTDYLKKESHGAATRLAADIGAYPADISAWASGTRPVPIKFAVLIEARTGGQVSRKDTRQTDWQAIWPELAQAPHAATAAA